MASHIMEINSSYKSEDFQTEKNSSVYSDAPMKVGQRFGQHMAARMRQLGISVPELARRMGSAGDQALIERLHKIRQGLVANPRGELPSQIANALGIAVGELRGEVGPTQQVRLVRVVGEVEATRWYESPLTFDLESPDLDRYPPIPIVPGRYADVPQFAVKVIGPSVNKVIPDGFFAVCVPYWEVRSGLTDGDLVVVERRDGGKFEGTIKRLRRMGREWQLWPESDDPRFHEPIAYKDIPGRGEVEIEIKGLVIWKAAPV